MLFTVGSVWVVGLFGLGVGVVCFGVKLHLIVDVYGFWCCLNEILKMVFNRCFLLVFIMYAIG